MDATMLDNAQVLREGYAAFARGDVPGVLERFDQGIEWTIPGPHSLAGVYEGHAGVGGFFERVATAYELQVRPEEFLPLDEERVLVLGTHVVDGAAGHAEIRFAHVWAVRDGRAVSFYEYTDTERLAEQVRA
jgi:ketosteroid isomerase-like protein